MHWLVILAAVAGVVGFGVVCLGLARWFGPVDWRDRDQVHRDFWEDGPWL